MSAVKEIKTIQMVTRVKVMKMLNWDDLQYGKFQMDQAYAYLNYMMPDDAWGKSHLPQTASFWAWWRNHWHKRDAEFVDFAKGMPVHEAVLFYEITHNAEAIEYTPHSVILADAYAKMIYEMTHKESEVCK